MNERLELHDAILLAISTEWQTGTATIQVRSIGDEVFDVIAFGVTEVSIPRENPWGPSKYINDIRGPDQLGSELQRLEIEMQSGDVIRVIAQTFRFPPTEARPKASHR